MADKRIIDFETLEELADDDLILVGNATDTYNAKVLTFRNAVSAIAAGKADGAYLKNGYLHLTAGDQDIARPIGPFVDPDSDAVLPAMSEATAGQYLTNDGSGAKWVSLTNAEEVAY